MSVNNTTSNAPSEMQPWVREIEKILADNTAKIAALQSQVKALQKKK